MAEWNDHSQSCQATGGETKCEQGLTSVWNSYQLHCHYWRPQCTPKALVCLCHGVTEHLGRYSMLGEMLADHGVFMFGHDHVGHGKSEGERVHIDTVETYVDDVVNHVEKIQGQFPNTQCFLMGHSMGGLIVAHVAVKRQDLFSGLILSAAPLQFSSLRHPVINTVAVATVTVLELLMPRVPIIPWDVNTVSSVPEEIKAFQEDPLIYQGRAKCGWMKAMIESIKIIEQTVAKITLPTLLIHGQDDRMVPIACSEYAYSTISSEDKTLEVFEENRHEVLHDKGQEEAMDVIRNWLFAHIAT